MSLRVLVLGGTGFIGRAVTEALVASGHDVTCVHRGRTTPQDWVDAEHLLADRATLPSRRAELAAVRPDVVVDTYAMTGADATAAVVALPRGVPVVVLSSMDVYQAYADALAGRPGRPVPLDETAPVRIDRYPYRGRVPGQDDYEKLDVEEVYRAGTDATVLRLPVVFGPFDPQHREGFILSRLAAGRRRIPFGPGTWLWSRLHVVDVAEAVRSAVHEVMRTGLTDEILNVAPARTHTAAQWARSILDAGGFRAELVPVPESVLPADLFLSRGVSQHLLFTPDKIRSLLSWQDADLDARVAQSVRWRLLHPEVPNPPPPYDPAPDDQALATVAESAIPSLVGAAQVTGATRLVPPGPAADQPQDREGAEGASADSTPGAGTVVDLTTLPPPPPPAPGPVVRPGPRP